MAITLDKKSDREYDVVLSERFDFGCVEDFRKVYESIDAQGKTRIKMDFRLTKYMDSSALGMLINAKTYFSSCDVSITLSNCNDQIKKIFMISRFDKKFDIC